MVALWFLALLFWDVLSFPLLSLDSALIGFLYLSATYFPLADVLGREGLWLSPWLVSVGLWCWFLLQLRGYCFGISVFASNLGFSGVCFTHGFLLICPLH